MTSTAAAAGTQSFAPPAGPKSTGLRLACFLSLRSMDCSGAMMLATETGSFNAGSNCSLATILETMLPSTCLPFNAQQRVSALKHRLLMIRGVPLLACAINLTAYFVNSETPL
jgi:hypothetical protein